MLPELVNPKGHDWRDPEWASLDLGEVDAFWARLKTSSKQEIPDLGLTRDALGDDYQQLFLHLLLDHVQHLLDCGKTGRRSEPLRLLLLGLPGSGKTQAVKTALQEMHAALERAGLPTTFVRAAAPTGSAAFNPCFPASTGHRLIHWFSTRYFGELEDGLK